MEESKDLDNMKIEELVGSLLTYELSFQLFRKLNPLLLKLQKINVKILLKNNLMMRMI
jgi:hypothetical protein